jgi:hypothetical protein
MVEVKILDKSGKSDVWLRLLTIKKAVITSTESDFDIELSLHYDEKDPAINLLSDAMFLNKRVTIDVEGDVFDCISEEWNRVFEIGGGEASLEILLRGISTRKLPPPFMQNLREAFISAGKAAEAFGSAAKGARAATGQASRTQEQVFKVIVPVDQQLVEHAGACHVCGKATRIRSTDGQKFEHVTCGGAA